jgi:hypothetical protein
MWQKGYLEKQVISTLLYLVPPTNLTWENKCKKFGTEEEMVFASI